MLITTFAFEHIVVWKDNRNIYIYRVTVIRKEGPHSKRVSNLVEQPLQSIGNASNKPYRLNRILQVRRVRSSEYRTLFGGTESCFNNHRLFVKRNRLLIPVDNLCCTEEVQKNNERIFKITRVLFNS